MQFVFVLLYKFDTLILLKQQKLHALDISGF